MDDYELGELCDSYEGEMNELRAEIERLQAALRWASKWMTPSIVSRDPEFEQHRSTIEAALPASPE